MRRLQALCFISVVEFRIDQTSSRCLVSFEVFILFVLISEEAKLLRTILNQLHITGYMSSCHL